jgi:hypothetical protein
LLIAYFSKPLKQYGVYFCAEYVDLIKRKPDSFYKSVIATIAHEAVHLSGYFGSECVPLRIQFEISNLARLDIDPKDDYSNMYEMEKRHVDVSRTESLYYPDPAIPYKEN